MINVYNNNPFYLTGFHIFPTVADAKKYHCYCRDSVIFEVEYMHLRIKGKEGLSTVIVADKMKVKKIVNRKRVKNV